MKQCSDQGSDYAINKMLIIGGMGTPEDYVNGIRLLLIGFCDQFRNMDIEQHNMPLWVKINKLSNYLRQSGVYVCSKLALCLKHCLFFHQPPNAHSIQWTYWIILLFFLLWRPFWNENIVNLCNWLHIHDNSSMNITKNGIWFLLWLFFFLFNENNERRQHIKTSSLQYCHEIKRMPSSLCVRVCLHRIKLISILKHFTERISNMIYCFRVKIPSVNGQMAILGAYIEYIKIIWSETSI